MDAFVSFSAKNINKKIVGIRGMLISCRTKQDIHDTLRKIKVPRTRNYENKIDDDNVFGFTDEYFDQVELNVSDSLDNKMDSWLENVRSVSEHNNFKILHLNINSMFNKFEHVFSLLNEFNFDIIALNEVKLDNTIPDKLYQHPKYNLKRRDRDSHRGGIMIYVKKCYKMLNYSTSAEL